LHYLGDKILSPNRAFALARTLHFAARVIFPRAQSSAERSDAESTRVAN
jgi:hypothetical protein